MTMMNCCHVGYGMKVAGTDFKGLTKSIRKLIQMSNKYGAKTSKIADHTKTRTNDNHGQNYSSSTMYTTKSLATAEKAHI